MTTKPAIEAAKNFQVGDRVTINGVSADVLKIANNGSLYIECWRNLVSHVDPVLCRAWIPAHHNVILKYRRAGH